MDPIPAEASPLMGLPAVIAVVSCFKGLVPDKFLHPIALVVGALMGVAAAFALGHSATWPIFAMSGLITGAAASGVTSGVKASGQDGPPPETTVETVVPEEDGALSIRQAPSVVSAELHPEPKGRTTGVVKGGVLV